MDKAVSLLPGNLPFLIFATGLGAFIASWSLMSILINLCSQYYFEQYRFEKYCRQPLGPSKEMLKLKNISDRLPGSIEVLLTSIISLMFFSFFHILFCSAFSIQPSSLSVKIIDIFIFIYLFGITMCCINIFFKFRILKSSTPLILTPSLSKQMNDKKR